MKKLYLRVSTDIQSNDRQEYLLKEKGYVFSDCIVYEEKISGKTKNRPMLIKMLSELEKGDVVVISDLSRLARSVKDLWYITDEISLKGATLISLKENIDLATSSGRLIFTMLGAIYEFERSNLSDRTREALRTKKANGQTLGRPVILDETNLENAINEYLNSKSSMKVIANKYNISDATLCNTLKKKGLKRVK